MTATIARLKRQLKRAGITQDDIAAAAGCTRTYVNHFLNGRRRPKRLRAVAERLLAEKREHLVSVA